MSEKKPPRDLGVVIGDMLGVIPETETELRADLTKVRNALGYQAPELLYLLWHECQEVLITQLGYPPNPEKPWAEDVERIFTGRTKNAST